MENTVQIQFINTFAQSGPMGYLDVDPNVQFTIDFSISDIVDPFSRKGTKSYKFTIIGTKEINNLLNNYYDINVTDGTYSVNKKQKVCILRNGIIILDNAYMQLLAVNKSTTDDVYSDQSVSYEVIVGDDTTNFFTEITNKFLTDLTFSDIDHVYNSTNVINSFSFPSRTLMGLGGYKYVLPYIQGSNAYHLEELKPAISVYEYWDRIHRAAGFQWEWTGYDSDDVRMDRLWIPYNGDQAKMHDQNAYRVEAETVTPYTRTSTPPIGQAGGIINAPVILDVEITDPHNDYDPVTGNYTSSIYTGTSALDVQFIVDFEFQLDNTSAGTVYSTTAVGLAPYCEMHYISQIGIYNITQNALNTINIWDAAIRPVSSGVPFSLAPGVNSIASGTFQTNILPLSGVNIGDVFYNYTGVASGNNPPYTFGGTLWLDAISGGALVQVNPILKINSIRMVILPKITSVGFNQKIFMNDYVPAKIKQSDFIKGICNMYNLIVDTDPTNDHRLIYRLRDDFYDSGAAKDWTQKIVTDRQSVIEFISNSNSRKIILTYKQDSDIANVEFYNSTKEIYGQLEYTLDNENIKGTDVKEIIFSPTPIAETTFGSYNPFIVGSSPKTNIRILLDGGVTNTGPDFTAAQTYDIIDYDVVTYDPLFPTVPIVTPHGVLNTLVTYPMLTHFDNPNTPRFDINFGLCDFYYFQGDTQTNNNLYSMYWRRTIGQINSGKLLTAYFYLTEFDISQLKLNDKIFVKDTWYNINRLQYDPNSFGPTKVELMTIDDSLSLPAFRKAPTTYHPSGVPDTVAVLNGVDTVRSQTLNNNYANSDVLVLGTGNIVTGDTKNVIVVGDNQRVEGGASNTVYAQNIVTQSLTINNTTIGSLPWIYDSMFNIIAVVDPSTVKLNVSSDTAVTFTATSNWNFVSGRFATVDGSYNNVSGVSAVLTAADRNIVGGDSNEIDGTAGIGRNNIMSGSTTFISNGENNIISGDTTSIIGGYNNIVGGNINSITGVGSASNIICGTGNISHQTLLASILFGNNNSLNSSGSFGNGIICGVAHILTGGTYDSNIISGSTNVLTTVTSFNRNIMSGFNNSLTDGNYSNSVISGALNVFTLASASSIDTSIISGNSNAITLTGTNQINCSIISGFTNIVNTVLSFNQSILCGTGNTLTTVTNFNGNIMSGENNILTNGSYQNNLIVGASHALTTSVNFSSNIVYGNQVTFTDADSLCNLVGGNQNTIIGTTVDVIMGGSRNAITRDIASLIVGEFNNMIDGVSNIIGGEFNQVNIGSSLFVQPTGNLIVGQNWSITGTSGNAFYDNVLCGNNNTATLGSGGQFSDSFVGGNNNTMNNLVRASLIVGSTNIINGLTNSMVCGLGNTATAMNNSILCGYNNDGSGQYGAIVFGTGNNKNPAIGGGYIGGGAIDQTAFGRIIWGGQTNGVTLQEIFIDAVSAQFIPHLASNSSYRFTLTAIAMENITAKSTSFTGTGVIRWDGVSAVIPVPIVMAVGVNELLMSSANITISADVVTNALKVEVTGLVATNLTWAVVGEFIQIAL